MGMGENRRKKNAFEIESTLDGKNYGKPHNRLKSKKVQIFSQLC